MKITEGDLQNDQVLALLRAHLSEMHENSPPGSVYALDLSGLATQCVSFYTAWDGESLMGMGALREIDAKSGEIKSMRTNVTHLRKGVGTALLEHMINEARRRGYRRLSLGTGCGQAFEPALSMYRKYGFENGTAFGSYQKSQFNQFLHLEL